MEIETLLLIVGLAIASAGIGLAAYTIGSRRKSNSKQLKENSDESTFVHAEGKTPFIRSQESHSENAVSKGETSASQITANVASIPVQEAPAPFPEETTSNATPAPTDITALAHITSPVDGTTPGILVIPTKRKSRARRLPTQGSAPRKRRSPKNKNMVPETVTFVETPQAIPPQETQPVVATDHQEE